ncbi:hypothetical protein BDK51DRAFT_39213 [Blyttiomyces helicus]|uniref:Uncharacterized protein n=1 Tax=Blyttiomyces helicus TaxID=388810 RepID=A0A4P9W6L4_9FUNG|nr:hypothetical protein BDK51DRAFT_39213 [Blyttiomyces helicus]|eukprot:RKO88101.1 hypothetical protein BDK51DRAFT_39213 [Blyttiomyces helicus]
MTAKRMRTGSTTTTKIVHSSSSMLLQSKLLQPGLLLQPQALNLPSKRPGAALPPLNGCRQQHLYSTRKMEAVTPWLTPRCELNVQEFLSIAIFFKSCINSVTKIVAPLITISGNGSWTSGPREETTFAGLNATTASNPILSLYNPTTPTYIFPDPSSNATSGSFSQPEDRILIPDNILPKKVVFMPCPTAFSPQTCYPFMDKIFSLLLSSSSTGACA